MKNDHSSLIIRIFALIFLAYGSFQFITGVKPLWMTLRFLFYPSNNTLSEGLYYFSMTFLFSVLIPTIACVSGIGLLKQKNWAWYFAIITTLIVFAVNLTGTLTFIIASYHYRNIAMPPIKEGIVVRYISMIPTYIYTVVSFLLIIILSRRSIRDILVNKYNA